MLATVFAALAVCALAFLEYRAWQKINFAEATFARAHSASLASGIEMQKAFATLKLSLLLFQVSGEDGNREAFHAETRRVSALIADSQDNASNDLERVVVNEIETEFNSFIATVGKLQPARALRRGALETMSAEIAQLLAPIHRSAARLVTIQNETRTGLQAESGAAFRSARTALKSSLVALAILLGSVVILIHRAFLVPLRMQLDATAAESDRRQKLASIGVLATGVAHEIRNPLTAIKFRLFSLRKSFDVDLASSEDFQTIRSEIDRLENLVKNFLEFARPAEPQFTQINAAELLQDVRHLLEPEMAGKNVTFKVDSTGSLVFRGDRQQLRQVLINLAQNAGESMPEGGVVTLRAHSGVAALHPQRKPAIMIDVIDTGVGIDLETQKRLFDPFFSTKEGGTGLGLAIAARIIEQHGGLIQFSSRKDEGSTFSIILPLDSNSSVTTHA
jgi:signal transduction histidine kinase